MRYPNICYATFLNRPNRFVAHVLINGREETVHVKNTGRCKELLVTGAKVCLVKSSNPSRRTCYDLVSVWKGDTLINMDAQAPNHLLEEYLPQSGWFQQKIVIRPEYNHGDSRFDFLITEGERKHLIEAKGVTLEENGIARFPDAPTERGVKHIRGLIRTLEEGFEPWIVFLVQMEGIRMFEPNDATHPAFGQVLREANAAGVHVLALGCHVTPKEVQVSYQIPIHL